MAKKLTLYLDDAVIEKAKTYSKKNRVSISKLVESYLKKLDKKQSSEGWIDKWVGIANAEEILKSRPNDKRLKRIFDKHVK